MPTVGAVSSARAVRAGRALFAVRVVVTAAQVAGEDEGNRDRADHQHQPRHPTGGAVAFLAIAVALAVLSGVLFVGLLLALVGFFLLAGLPMALDWSELESGPDRAGTATGFLLLAGNLGGVVVVLVVQAALGNPYLAMSAMSAVVVPGLLLAARLPRHARSHIDDDRRIGASRFNYIRLVHPGVHGPEETGGNRR